MQSQPILKQQLQRELNLARRVDAGRACDLAEVGVAERRGRVAKDRMVWQVESLGAKLKADLLSQLEGFKKRHVHNALIRSVPIVARRVTQGERRGHAKSRWIEELSGDADRRIRDANVTTLLVRALRAAADDAADRLLICDGEGQPGLPNGGAVDLPAAESLSGRAFQILAERKFVVRAERPAVFDVEITGPVIIVFDVGDGLRKRAHEVAVTASACAVGPGVVNAVSPSEA